MDRPTPQLGTQNDTLVPRILAFLVDSLVVGIAATVLVVVVGLVSESLAGVVGGLAGIGALAYFIYLEGTYGQTLGKRVLGIVVVTEDGGDCDLKAAAIRNLLRIVDALPFLYLIGIVLIFVTDDGQRLGDILGNTVVVRTQ
ncbi:RDD family protein [Haloparvum sedimenti]|uniref:RDD family protein n=1 Tax=Haloparvum sedimenti TaxID=1678448 RepID=UPI00071E8EB7|nr:RDD family protein [Haloparvum sedimenti]